ncbi:protein FAM228B [Xenopus laevis]|uniref:protein FAM228B n=2 Tax=Xenopus laevis TaxID=8355 RepID=A0A1L8G5B6_XENLA|nr:protein FAM228B [Xenopus laevis]XP_018121468.1 protein FAM228B [Xenopus laevis]OCT79042.1 hypothetical protein XELAEV_18030138mg [Xenopus laevis]
MSAGRRSPRKDGNITMQSNGIPSDSLPGTQHQEKEYSRDSGCVRTRSSPGGRIMSTASNRKARDWLAHKPNIQLLIDEENQEIRETMHHLLDVEHHFNQSLTKYLKKTDDLELRRKEMQHKRWTERVSDPLQKTIQSYVDAQTARDIERRRRFVLAQYLKYCNKKGFVFLRDYDSTEYDPFSHQISKQYLRVFMPQFLDPLLQQSQRRVEEESITLHCETGRIYSAREIHELNMKKLPQVPLGRHGMNGIEWVKAPFGYIESEIRQKSRQRIRGTFNKESHNFKT